MLLPHHERAYIPQEKLNGYLLSETHPIGRFKARLLSDVGCDSADAHILDQALIEIAHEEEVTETNPTLYGTMCVINDTLQTPSGAALRMQSVWIIPTGESSPRLVTAYPV